MGNMILQNLTQDELEAIIQSKLEEQFAKLTKELTSKSDSEELMTRDDACKFLKINSSTLWHWTNKGKVKAYAIGSRRFYKRSELLESIQPVQQ
ncbi:MAG: helix-turn-helix domain-containing protein [Muricauda sp.]|nr:helix-turn-helix domain-containing protein [Allomuricauda sp.]MBA4746271.1 helix-turn-helix domain-containing protein [Allomuricauda sp.]